MKKIFAVIAISVVAFSMFSGISSLVKAEADECSEPQQLTTNPAYDYHPSILEDSSGKIWLVWASAPSPEIVDSNSNLWCKTSLDGGITWSTAEMLVTIDLGVSGTSMLQDSTGRIWLAWASGPGSAFNIYYITSNDGGVSWSPRQQLTDYPGDEWYPSLIEVSDEVWIIFGAYGLSHNEDIWYRNTSDGGANWSDPIQLTEHPTLESPGVALVDSSGKIWVSWSRRVGGPKSHNIYYKTSINNGVSWSPDQELTTHPAVEQKSSIIEDSSGRIFAFYDATMEPELPHIWYKTTEDGGDNWSDYQELTDTFNDQCPYAVLINDEIWVIWQSFDRSESADIWMSKVTSVPSKCMLEWSRTYMGGGDEGMHKYAHVVQTCDEGYAISGFTDLIGAGKNDFWLVKTNSTGHIEWNRTYGGADDDWAFCLIQTADEGYAITGETRSFGSGGSDFWLVKANSTGHVEWNKTYGTGSDDVAYSVVQARDGGYVLVGRTQLPNYDFFMVKTNSAGHMEWSRTYGEGMYSDNAESIIQTSDGGYAIAGETKSYGAGGWDFWLVKTGADGDMKWNQTYGGTSHEMARSLVQTEDGGYALAGHTESFGEGGRDFWLVKTDSTGHAQWNKTYGNVDFDEGWSLVQTCDGGYAIAGFTDSYGAGHYDFWLVKTNSTGHIEWNQTYGATGHDAAYSLVQTCDGGYGVVGRTSSSVHLYNLWLIKLVCIRATGEEILDEAISSFEELKEVLASLDRGAYDDILNQYLEPALSCIVDGNYLYIDDQDGIKKGETAFDMLKEATDKIQSNLLDTGTLDSDTEAKLVIIQEEIVEVARLLADTLLTDLDEAGLTDSSAIEEYDKGQQYFNEAPDQSTYGDQIAKYKEAWKQGVKALEKQWDITTGIARPP